MMEAIERLVKAVEKIADAQEKGSEAHAKWVGYLLDRASKGKDPGPSTTEKIADEAGGQEETLPGASTSVETVEAKIEICGAMAPDGKRSCKKAKGHTDKHWYTPVEEEKPVAPVEEKNDIEDIFSEEEKAPAGEKVYTFDEVKKALLDLSEKDENAPRNIVKSFGVAKLSEIPSEKYGEVMEKVSNA